ncbi:MAG: sigma-70 family RNA polymerase sigma factor [Dehalococcoidia bacterium]
MDERDGRPPPEGTPVGGIEPDDETLVRRVVQRDAEAFARLYDRYTDLVYSVALRVVADPALAQDAAQDVFLRLWRRPEAYDASRGRFVSWLVSVARNRAVDEVRMRGRRRVRELGEFSSMEDPPDGRAEDPQLAVQVQADRVAVRRALAQLPEDQRKALEMAYFSGLTQQEIAEQLQQPLGTIKTRTRLAMRKLRTLLSAEVETPYPV